MFNFLFILFSIMLLNFSQNFSQTQTLSANHDNQIQNKTFNSDNEQRSSISALKSDNLFSVGDQYGTGNHPISVTFTMTSANS